MFEKTEFYCLFKNLRGFFWYHNICRCFLKVETLTIINTIIVVVIIPIKNFKKFHIILMKKSDSLWCCDYIYFNLNYYQIFILYPIIAINALLSPQ